LDDQILVDIWIFILIERLENAYIGFPNLWWKFLICHLESSVKAHSTSAKYPIDQVMCTVSKDIQTHLHVALVYDYLSTTLWRLTM
jgi:hypothetical protein